MKIDSNNGLGVSKGSVCPFHCVSMLPRISVPISFGTIYLLCLAYTHADEYRLHVNAYGPPLDHAMRRRRTKNAVLVVSLRHYSIVRCLWLLLDRSVRKRA